MGYAKYHSIVMRTITLHTIHAGALENYTKSNNIKKNVNRTLIGNRGHSLCTDVPSSSGKIGRGDVRESAVVNRAPVYICINYIFVLSLTVEKAHVGQKIALASVHRLAEHLHAMSTQNPDIRSLITVKPGQAYLPRCH